MLVGLLVGFVVERRTSETQILEKTGWLTSSAPALKVEKSSAAEENKETRVGKAAQQHMENPTFVGNEQQRISGVNNQ